MNGLRGFTTTLPVVLTAFFVMGCEQAPTSPDGEVQTLAEPLLSSHAGKPVVFSARGSGHFEGPPPGGSDVGWRTFSFTAQQRRDGTTTGHFQFHTKGGQRQHGRVFCMADLGNDLVAIGAEGTQRIPENDPPNSLGSFGVPDAVRPGNHGSFFVVKDNGEGSKASGPDLITGAAHTTLGFVAGLCAAGRFHPLAGLAPGFLVPIEAGNVQVSP